MVRSLKTLASQPRDNCYDDVLGLSTISNCRETGRGGRDKKRRRKERSQALSKELTEAENCAMLLRMYNVPMGTGEHGAHLRKPHALQCRCKPLQFQGQEAVLWIFRLPDPTMSRERKLWCTHAAFATKALPNLACHGQPRCAPRCTPKTGSFYTEFTGLNVTSLLLSLVYKFLCITSDSHNSQPFNFSGNLLVSKCNLLGCLGAYLYVCVGWGGGREEGREAGGDQRSKAISLGPEYMGVSSHYSYNSALSFKLFYFGRNKFSFSFLSRHFLLNFATCK